MSRKTLALLASLIIITVVLLGLALTSSRQKAPQPAKDTTTQEQPTPAPIAKAVLSLSPNPVIVPASGTTTVDVVLNTADHQVSGVQFEIEYDPKSVTVRSIEPGSFFANATTPLKEINASTGKISYFMGLPPGQTPLTGEGPVARITVSRRAGAVATESPMNFLPKTYVASIGIATSVLKSSTGTVLQLSSTGSTSSPVTTTTTPTQ